MFTVSVFHFPSGLHLFTKVQLVNVQISQVEPLVSGLSSFRSWTPALITQNLSLRNMYVYIFSGIQYQTFCSSDGRDKLCSIHQVMMWVGGEYAAGFEY